MPSHRRPPTSRSAILGVALLLIAAAPGCFFTSNDSEDGAGDVDDSAGGEGDGDDGGDGGGGPPPTDALQCESPAECVPAASTCCECPSFAVAADSAPADGCADVDCQTPPPACPLVETACIEFQCQLICSPVVTERVCDGRFARDDFGCLIDDCDGGRGAECTEDVDCAQVPADCCGCAEGGDETSVPVGEVAAHLESLECPRDPACPGVNVCDASLVPRCLGGGCALAPADDEDGPDGGPDGGAPCGTVEQPSCPVGQVCVLNHPDAGDATRLGVGTCHSG